MRLAWLWPLACILPFNAEARGLTVEDLLSNEQYTQILPATRAGVVVVGRTRPYRDAGDYQYDWFTRRVLSELWTFSPGRPGGLVRLLGGQTGTGYWAAGLSPSGRRLAVFRLSRNRLDLGIVDLATRGVRWLTVAPDMPYANPNPSWLDDDHVLLVTRPDRSLPWMLDFAFDPARRSPVAWATTSLGRSASVSSLGSGRKLGQRDRSPSRDLIVYDLRSGGIRRLVQKGDIADVLLSHDRRQVAVMRDGVDIAVDQTRPADPADLTRAHQLDLIDLRSGRITSACRDCDALPNLLSWSASSSQLLFYARSPNMPWTKGALYVARISPGKASASPATPFPGFDALIDPAAPGVIAVHARWMGEQPVLLGAPAKSAGGLASPIDWYVAGPRGPRALTAGAGSSAQVLASSAGTIAYLTKGRLLRGTPDGPPTPILPDDHVEWAIASLDPVLEGTRRALNPDPDGTTLMIRHGQKVMPIDLSGTGKVLRRYSDLSSDSQIVATLPAQDSVLTLDPLEGGSTTLALNSRDGVTPFGTLNSNLSDVVPATAVVLKDKDADGQVIQHHLYLPTTQGTSPLVVLPYPGTVLPAVAPRPDVAAFIAVTNVQLLVAQGYAVLEPSMPVPQDGKGRAWSNPLDRIAHQIEGAIGAAIATGRIDRTRVAVYGHSYGGYAALAMATHGEVVRSVIASAAPTNLAAAYGVIDPRAKTQDSGISTVIAFGWFEGGQGALGTQPWVSPERYVAASPVFHAGEMTVPVLLIHGEFDYLPVAGAEQLFMTLYRQNKTALLLRYAAEGHSIRSPGNIRDEWSHIFAWLAEMGPPYSPPKHSDADLDPGSGTLPIAHPSLDRRVQHQRSGEIAP